MDDKRKLGSPFDPRGEAERLAEFNLDVWLAAVKAAKSRGLPHKDAARFADAFLVSWAIAQHVEG